MPDNGILVVFIELDDPIVSPERPEKLHFQLCLRLWINRPCFATN